MGLDEQFALDRIPKVTCPGCSVEMTLRTLVPTANHTVLYTATYVNSSSTHECLAIRINRRLKAIDVIDVLSDLFILRGVPGHIRSDNGPEFLAKALQDWIKAVGAKTAYIAPGSPWENGFIE